MEGSVLTKHRMLNPKTLPTCNHLWQVSEIQRSPKGSIVSRMQSEGDILLNGESVFTGLDWTGTGLDFDLIILNLVVHILEI